MLVSSQFINGMKLLIIRVFSSCIQLRNSSELQNSYQIPQAATDRPSTVSANEALVGQAPGVAVNNHPEQQPSAQGSTGLTTDTAVGSSNLSNPQDSTSSTAVVVENSTVPGQAGSLTGNTVGGAASPSQGMVKWCIADLVHWKGAQVQSYFAFLAFLSVVG